MKTLILICLLCVTFVSFGQHYLIPIRVGNQFGLCDENKKIIVQPEYDVIHYNEHESFKTIKKVALQDTLWTEKNHAYVRKNRETELTGLIYKGQVILQDEPFEEYSISNQVIIAKGRGEWSYYTQEQFNKYGRQRQVFALFNLKGNNVHPENFYRLQLMDKTGVSKNDPKEAAKILFASENFERKRSLFIYDTDQQKITTWLLKDVEKLKYHIDYDAEKIDYLEYRENGLQVNKKIKLEKGTFVLNDFAPMQTKSTDEPYLGNTERAGDEAMDWAPEMPDSQQEPSKIYKGDYHITKQGSTYGLLRTDKVVAVPFIYDSIIPNYHELYFAEDRNGQKHAKFHHVPAYSREIEDTIIEARYNGKNNVIQVFKDGKTGLIDQNNNVLLPINYDHIGMNHLGFIKPYTTFYFILHKAGKYSAAEETSTGQIKLLNQPDFNYIPCARIENYYGIKDLTVFALYNEHFELMYYATSIGILFTDVE